MRLMKFSTTDEQLIEGCLKNDSRSQEALFERYRKRMYAVCYRYIPDNFEAEDVMLTGFVKVYQNLKQYTFQGSFEGWMRRIMVHESLMLFRTKKMMYVEANEINAHQYSSTPEQLGFNLQEQDLLEVIQELPEGYRTVFNLYAIEGYNHKEIGEMLGISEGTSKSQLSRARTLLQEKLMVLETNNEKHYE